MEASTKRKRHTDHCVMISDLFSYIIQKKMIKRNFLQKNSEENNALEEIKFEEAKIEYINKNNELEEDKCINGNNDSLIEKDEIYLSSKTEYIIENKMN
ncbi:hypothetical protein U3516DRAFT_769532 [Neocallimastix sp. 'constans']